MKTAILVLEILALLIFLACEQPGKSDQPPKGEAGVSGKATQTETSQETTKPAVEPAKQGVVAATTGTAQDKTQ
jgi:hypothetical protein